MHDLAMGGGTVVDGSGAPARAADIAIDGDRIGEAIHRVGHGVFEYSPDHVDLGGEFARLLPGPRS
jgi:hypothetical protein